MSCPLSNVLIVVCIIANYLASVCTPPAPLFGTDQDSVVIIIPEFLICMIIAITDELVTNLTLTGGDVMDVYSCPMEKDGIFWLKLSVPPDQTSPLYQLAFNCRYITYTVCEPWISYISLVCLVLSSNQCQSSDWWIRCCSLPKEIWYLWP